MSVKEKEKKQVIEKKLEEHQKSAIQHPTTLGDAQYFLL